MYSKCLKCGGSSANEVVIASAYHTALCLNCKNLWERFYSNHHSFNADPKLENEAIMLCGMTAHDGEDRTEQLNRITELRHADRRARFALAESWVASGMTDCQ